jgi:hypothetical protein
MTAVTSLLTYKVDLSNRPFLQLSCLTPGYFTLTNFLGPNFDIWIPGPNFNTRIP